MSLHEHMKNGIYIDETTGDIWRKSNDKASWTVNGEVWTPFPKALSTLTTVVSTPAVSITDAVIDEYTQQTDWAFIPSYPNYEVNRGGHVRDRDTKVSVSLCCDKPQHAYYWLADSEGVGDWVGQNAVKNEAFSNLKNHGQ